MKNQLSFSKLRTFETCPKMYDYKYVQKLPTFQTEAMKFGIDLHQTISDELLEKNPDYTVFSCEKLSEVERMVDNAIQYIEGRTVVGSEQQFGMTENFEEATYEEGMFKGIVDAIIYDPEEGMEVIDFKTNYAGYPKEQLLFYALLLNANFKVLPDKLTYFSLRLNQAVSHTISAKELEDFKEKLLKQKHEIEATKEFKEKPGEHCSLCSFIHKCLLAAKTLELPQVATPAQAKEILLLGELHSAFASECKKLAQNFVKETGEAVPDEEGKRIFSPNTTEAVKITDMEQLMERLQEEGYEPDMYKHIDTKLLKRIPEYRKKFDSCIKIMPRTTYKWTKISSKKEENGNVERNSHSTRKTA